MSDHSPLIGNDDDIGSARFRANELDRHIGQRLRFVRRLSGWSQRELGNRLALTFQQVQKYENGANRVSAALLVEVAGLFHVPIEWFVGPYNDAAAPPGARSPAFGALLDLLFRNDVHSDDTARAASLATICQLVRVDPARGQRLDAIRLALAASTPQDADFILEAARRVTEQAASSVAAPAPRQDGAAGHVLLVDDDPEIVATLSVSLAAAGFAVTTASGGSEALALLGGGLSADVLVTDYAMFGMDGVELLAQAAVLRPSLPGLVVTGFADSERLKDLRIGVEVLRKPFRRMELVGRLRLLLEQSRPPVAPISLRPARIRLAVPDVPSLAGAADRRPIGAWTVGAVLAGIVAVLCAVVGLAMLEARRMTESRAKESLSNVMLSLDGALTRDFLAFEVLLQAHAAGAAAPSSTLPWSGLRADLLGSFGVYDADGRFMGAGSNPESTWVQTALEAHRRDQTPGLRVGEIDVGSRSSELRLVLSRPREDAYGRFAGVTGGSIRLAYFRELFANYRLGDGGVIALLTLDGRLVSAAPMSPGSQGRDLSNSQVMQRLKTLGPGAFKAVSVADGKQRFYVASRLEKLPFYLVVGRLTADIHSGWNLYAGAAGMLVLGVLAVLALMSRTLHRELQRRRNAEIKARRSAARAQATAAELETVAGNADDLILKIDWDGARRYVSEASERLLGYSPDELLGQDSLQFTHPEDVPHLVRLLARLREDGSVPARIGYRLQHRDGSWRQVEARCRALPDGSGVIVAVRDRTEQMELEARLRQAQKMEAVGQLTAGIAHDFNNLLQGQVAALELLLDEVEGQSDATRLAERAIATAERGARLTHSLLAFSRQQVLRPEPVDVAVMLDDLAVLLSGTLGSKVTLTVTVDPRLPRPLADRTQLESALLNLCLNARDAMRPNGGRITVAASAELEVASTGGRRQPRSMVVLSVTDNGPGMPEHVLARVCEPFFTTKKLGEGSGLGLSMVQGFAQQSGGELHLRSAPGQGTCVQVRLPAAPAPAEAQAASPDPAGSRAGQHGGRILLVDDDDDVLSHLAEALTASGFKVTTATSGAKAAQILKTSSVIDVLVTDFGMPGMSGTALAQLAATLRPGLPAVIVTGHVDDDLLQDIPPNASLLHKPFRLDNLVDRISAAREMEMAE